MGPPENSCNSGQITVKACTSDINCNSGQLTDLATGPTVQSPLFGSGNQNIAEMAVANDGTVAMFGDVYFNCGATSPEKTRS